MARGRKRKGQESPGSSERSKKKPNPEETSETPEEEAETTSAPAKKGLQVHPKRIREMRGGEIKKGPVIYW